MITHKEVETVIAQREREREGGRERGREGGGGDTDNYRYTCMHCYNLG